MINATNNHPRRRSVLFAGLFAISASVLSPLATSHAGAQSEKELSRTAFDGKSISYDDSQFAPGKAVVKQYTLVNKQAATRTLTICDRFESSLALTGTVSSSSRGKFIYGGQPGDSNFCYSVSAESATPVKVGVEVKISEDAKPGTLVNQAWVDLDGNPKTVDQLPADSGISLEVTPLTIIDPTVYILDDAGLGEGPTCPATPDEKMLPPVDINDVAVVDVATSLYANNFDEHRDGFELLSGSWALVDGSFRQQNTCGFDYTSLLMSKPVEHFAVKAEIRIVDGAGRAGFVFNQTSKHTRSSASVVELIDDGKAIQWGHYDSAGFYQFDGKVETPKQIAVGESFTLAVESHGDVAVISLNGEELAKMKNLSKRGYVGLVTSQTVADYDAIKLAALPAS